jgi:hypothetical protein
MIVPAHAKVFFNTISSAMTVSQTRPYEKPENAAQLNSRQPARQRYMQPAPAKKSVKSVESVDKTPAATRKTPPAA